MFFGLLLAGVVAGGIVGTVDTRVGTAHSETLTAGVFGKKTEELGQTLPAVAAPHGMNLWTPQTRDTEHKCVAPYYYADSLLQGFRNSHWIVGGCTQDYGSFTVMPLTGTLRTRPDLRGSRFSHDTEIATPSYYRVELPDEHLVAELTGTSRAGILRLVYDRPGRAWLVVNPNSDEAQGTISVEPHTGKVSATNPVHRIYQGKGEPAGFSGYFTLHVDRPVVEYGAYCGDTVLAGLGGISMRPEIGVYLGYDVEAGDTVTVRMGSSFVDQAGAEANLVAELPHWDFDRARADLEDVWNRDLGRIEVEGGDRDALAMFYGALYRTSLLPRVINDADGRYKAFGGSGVTLTVPEGRSMYDDFSMWDTYRALHPLKVITHPSMTADMMQSLVAKGEQGGWLPIFPCWNSYTAAMIGDHCTVAIADAWVKGVRDFDIGSAYRLMRRNAFETPSDSVDYRDGKGRRALDSYLKYGYIPVEDSVPWAYHKREQVSRTLEYAFDDFALSRVADDLGYTDDAVELARRSLNYRNVINPVTGYACGRHADGRWVSGDEACPFTFQRYITEGAPCHYTWYVPHDVDGLVEACGGREAFIARLDSLFDQGRYWHGNEPCHQVAWMAALVGEPSKTRERVRHVMATEYLDRPGGLSGNDDAGQMSAWYVFAAMGFYPVCPATTGYVIGSPAFERMVIHLENGLDFTILAHGAGAENRQVKSMRLNGVPCDGPMLSHADIISGGTLELEMCP
ncbi:MAG: GH92 family glycosyl hydrolase [Muribaculaceae bacterium]|nr:GH92 family glycosyl hydrolase [Muribaculaceae bacterium]